MYLSGLPKLHKGCQIHFCVSRGNLVFLSRHYSGKGPHLALRGKSPGFSRVAAGSLGFLSSCKRDLMDLLVLPRRSQVFFHVARGTSGILSSHRRGIGLCLEFCWSTQCSCPAAMGISGFLSRFNKGVRPRLVLRHGTRLSSRVVRGVRPPVGFRWGIRAFLRGSARESCLPSCCAGILGVTLELVQGNQDLSRVEGEFVVLSPCSRSCGIPLKIQ